MVADFPLLCQYLDMLQAQRFTTRSISTATC